MVKSRIVRISEELVEEIERVARKNQIKIVEASREVARMMKNNKNKKLTKDIQF